MTLLLAGLALAHVPHDTVAMVAAPEDADSTWWSLANPQGAWLLLKSDTRALTWDMVGGDPLAQDPRGLALAGETVVVLGNHKVYASNDEGVSWSTAPAPEGATCVWARNDKTLVFAGDGGVFEGPVDGPWVTTAGPDVTTTCGPGPSAVDAEGHAWGTDDKGWVDMGIPPAAAVSVAAGEGMLWAGGASGELWRGDGEGWSDCAPPPPLDPDHPELVRLLSYQGGVLAMFGGGGPFWTDSDCAEWVDFATGRRPAYSGSGAAKSSFTGYTALVEGDGVVAVAGWDGITTADNASAWREAAIVPANHTRGIAWLDTDHVVIGSYGAGLFVGGADGDELVARGVGISDSNVQRVNPIPGTDVWWALSGHQEWRSTDAGSTWTRGATNHDEIADLFAVSADFARFVENGALWEIVDGGPDCRLVAGAAEALGGAEVFGGGLAASGRGCVVSTGPARIACHDKDGVWIPETELGAGPPSDPVVDAGGVPGLVVVGAGRGVWQSADGGLTWSEADVAPGDAVVLLGAADDGTLFAVTRTGRIFRSLDQGSSWSRLAVPLLPARAYVAAAAPDFANHDTLLLGTHDGPYALTHARGEARLGRWSAAEFVDDQSSFLSCAGCAPADADPQATMGSRSTLSAGGEARAWLRGTNVSAIGSGEGRGELVIDGSEVMELSSRDDNGVLGELIDLTPGWHDVQLQVTEGSFSLDRLQSDSAIRAELHPQPEDCGCGGAGGASAAGTVVAACWSRQARRRR